MAVERHLHVVGKVDLSNEITLSLDPDQAEALNYLLRKYREYYPEDSIEREEAVKLALLDCADQLYSIEQEESGDLI
jgi:hypothetical protein